MSGILILIALLCAAPAHAAEQAPYPLAFEQRIHVVEYWQKQCQSAACHKEAQAGIREVKGILARLQYWTRDPHRTIEGFEAIRRDERLVSQRLRQWADKYNILPLPLPASVWTKEG